MVVRRDFWEGVNEKGKVKFFPAEEHNPLIVAYLHPDQNEIWVESFTRYDHQLINFIKMLEDRNTQYNVFGFWPGKSRSDTFPLNKEVVKTLCEMNSNSNDSPSA